MLLFLLLFTSFQAFSMLSHAFLCRQRGLISPKSLIPMSSQLMRQPNYVKSSLATLGFAHHYRSKSFASFSTLTPANPMPIPATTTPPSTAVNSGGINVSMKSRQELERMLLNELKDWRRRTADELQRPIFRIASSSLIETIASRKPKDMEQLSLLSGFGQFKLRQYGQMILNIVLKYPHPDDPKGFVFDPNDLIDTEQFWNDARAKKSKSSPRKTKKTISPAAKDTEDSEQEQSPKIDREDLNEEKQIAAKQILAGNNVFITGSAGTGKSFLLKFIIQELIATHGESAVAVTGSTGISAVNIGGQTIHSFSGIGLGRGDREKIIEKVIKNKSSADRWRDTKALIIDEISMVDRQLFELVDEVARRVRGNNLPFGGVQLILVGDFMQLPPVREKNSNSGDFCFLSDSWDAAGLNNRSNAIYLNDVVRQDDPEFVKYLNEVRVGIFSPGFQRRLAECMIPFKPKPTNGIIPTKLYATNKQVDKENADHLHALPGEVVKIVAVDKWKDKPSKSSISASLREGLDKLIPYEIELKVGAQVMLLRNRSKMTMGGNIRPTAPGLVNGSRGTVVAFTESVTRPGLMLPTVQFDNGMITTIGPVEYNLKGHGGDGEISRFQIPLKLAWASTVHKSQGVTLTCAELVLNKAFDYGQVYVALSRVRDLQGLWLPEPISPKAIRAHPDVLRFYGYLD